jgi:hypothetical protein
MTNDFKMTKHQLEAVDNLYKALRLCNRSGIGRFTITHTPNITNPDGTSVLTSNMGTDYSHGTASLDSTVNVYKVMITNV